MRAPSPGGRARICDDDFVDATESNDPDILDGFVSIPVDGYASAPGDAAWSPNLRGITLLFLTPAFLLWAFATIWIGLSRGDWWGITTSGDGWPIFLVGGLGAEMILLRTGGKARCLFTGEWVGIQRRRDIATLRYDNVRTTWVVPKTGMPLLQMFASPPQIHAVRADGVPVALPKLLCLSARNRREFVKFVETQAAQRGLPIQDKPASSMAYWEESP